MNVIRAISARDLSRMRNSALKAGNLAAANAIREAQCFRKRGLNAAAQDKLASVGLAVDSQKMRSTFPVESRLLKRHYRVCQNLKGESHKRSTSYDGRDRSEFDHYDWKLIRKDKQLVDVQTISLRSR